MSVLRKYNQTTQQWEILQGGVQGLQGPPVALSKGTVATGAPGTNADFTVTGTPPNQKLNLTIPRGEKGDTGNPTTYLIVGPGRPDTPSTTGGIITGSEPVGAEYRSTDGAGVGAWVWMKRPTGWVVADGDTGWRDITALLAHPNMTSGTISVRRVGAQVVVQLSNLNLTGGGNFTAENAWPVGFRISMLPGNRVAVFALSGQGVGETPTWGNVQAPGYSSTNQTLHSKAAVISLRGSGVVEYHTNETWPTTLPGTPA